MGKNDSPKINSIKRWVKSWFNFSFESHSYDTKWSNLCYPKIPSYPIKSYSMFVNAINMNLFGITANKISYFTSWGQIIERDINYFFLNRYNKQNFHMCLQILNFAMNKFALKLIQIFPLVLTLL